MNDNRSNLHSINAKITATFFTLIIFIIISILYFSHTVFKTTITETQKQLTKSLVNTLQLSIDRISFSGKYHAQIFADSIIEREKDILFIYILSEDNKVIALSKKPNFKTALKFDVNSYLDLMAHGDHLNDISDKYLFSNETCCEDLSYHQMVMPYRADFDNTKSGIIIVGVSSANVEEKLNRNVIISLLIGAFTSLIALTFALHFSQKLSRPVNNLAQTFNGLLKYAPVNIIIRKKSGEIVEASSHYREIFEQQFRSNLVRKSYLNQWKFTFSEIDEHLRRGDSLFRKEFVFMNGESEEVYTTISFKITDKNSNEENYCTIGINTSEENKFRKELEMRTYEAKKASEAKTSFLATMSHEIRTPLTSIIGFLGLLEDSILSDTQEKYIKTAMGASENLLALINDILDYSKIESKDFKLEYGNMSIDSLCEDLAGIFEHQVKEKNIEFRMNLENDVHKDVVTDSLRLRQVLINLIGNAIKFTPKGYIELGVKLLGRDGEYERLRFSVTDTGIGIAKEQLTNIFEQFSQADNSISRNYGGTGLGLSITRKLIQMMGGSIHVSSEVGTGSTFYFDLDFKMINESELMPKRQKGEELSDIDLSKRKILVVDDEESNRQLMNLYMSKLGVNIDFCDNGADSIPMVIDNKYDLVLMDIQMPGLDGVQTLKEIREFERMNNLDSTKIFAFTANVFKEQLDEYRDQGFSGYLLKPFKKSDIVDFIRTNLS
ncbi:ATP-binding protein [Bacteriovorax sp. Seq25_V]|uniref:ATP-binding protein n=1 Tax=Bacteriovorax sp. Seq25_V TaxID=1201288 RepID=UPI00038A13C7|nr:ATP-binding protein [Bacteriovorax sp. Seq25_V]EQC44356.1 GHKL domain protein [Bacteriovorax sp. Seq25_V]